MTTDQDLENSGDDPEVIDQEKLQDMIREAVREIVPEFLQGDSDDEEAEPEPEAIAKPAKNADIEAEVRRQMQEAMKALQVKKPSKPKTKPVAEKAEAEEAPTPPKKKVDIGKLLWGN